MIERINDNDIVIFKISDTQKITIDLNCKLEDLSFFTIVNVVYTNTKTEKTAILYYQDYISEAISTLYDAIVNVKKRNLRKMPNDFDISTYGLNYYIELLRNRPDEEGELMRLIEPIESKYTLWSTPSCISIQTYLYLIDLENICIEISPSYKWYWLDPEEYEGEEQGKFFPFDEFIDNYQMIDKVIFPIETTKEWMDTCYVLLKKIFDYDKSMLERVINPRKRDT